MGAIRFPLISDNQSASNQVSPQDAAKLPSGAARKSTVFEPDIVTLSAVFPPPPPVDAPNFVQFRPAEQPAVQAFPPHLANNAPRQPASTTIIPTRTTLSEQEQLVQLNQTLQRLGISPQSISLDNRLALLKSANDPPALLNLVHALGVIDPQARSLGANNLSSPAQAATQLQAAAPAQSQALSQSQVPTLSPNSSSPAGSGFETSLEASTVPSPSTQQTTAAGNPAAQFQELQLAFQATDLLQTPPANPGSSGPQAPSLNVQA